MSDQKRYAAETSKGSPAPAGPVRVGVVGRGRVGTALAAALREAGYEVDGPAGRGEVAARGVPGRAHPASRGDAIVLCVPDAEIPAAAEAVAGMAELVGHTSGATALSALAPALEAGAEGFGLHPLQTFAGGDSPERFHGVGCAVAGTTAGAASFASDLARRLQMRPFEIDDSRRAAYHAAAAVASNFLVTLQDAAEQLAAAAGLDAADARSLLAPLVRQTVENWAELGPERALTGPVARGDEPTVAAHRAAVEAGAPELVSLFDALVERTRELADRADTRKAAA